VLSFDAYNEVTGEAEKRAKELEALKTRLNGIESKFGSMIQSWEQFKEAIFYDKKFTLDNMRMKLGLEPYIGLDKEIIFAANQTENKLKEAKKELL
jgi:hypothetical protein